MSTLAEAVEVLNAVCRGEVQATAHDDPYLYYCGNVCYELSNGWKVQVFNDCGEWDYVDSVTAPDGTEFHCAGPDHGKPDNWCSEIGDWTPTCGSTDGDGCEHWGFYTRPNDGTRHARQASQAGGSEP